MRTATDWMLMKIFDTKVAAEADLPKWGNPVAPPHLFSVRELSEELEFEARRNGCELARKWKPGEVARYPNRTCPRYQIISTYCDDAYCVLSQNGDVSYKDDADLLTLTEWLAWWERFQDETIPKDWRECAENARRDFVPPPWWAAAVRRATAPTCKGCGQALDDDSIRAGEHSLCNDPEAKL